MAKKFNILIVDDLVENRFLLSCILASNFKCVNVLEANNGESGLQVISNENIHLIISDVQMPTMDGFEFIYAVKQNEKTKDIPIILLTGVCIDKDFVKKGFHLGAMDYILKPFDDIVLISRVSFCLNLVEKIELEKTLRKHIEEEVLLRKKVEEEKRNQEELLIQQNKMATMGKMIGAIAHQLKQPINAISLYAQTIHNSQEYEVSKEEVEDICNRVLEQTRFMSDTINDFRTFLIPFQKIGLFRPCELAEEIAGILKKQFEILSVNFKVHEHEHFSCIGYPNEFKQVLLNIFVNAKDVFEERKIKNGRIDVFVSTEDKVGKIRICDNGGGIPKELLPDKLFDSYISTKGDSGTGIGLSLSKTIIESKMNGKLYAKNNDEGAEFIIELPTYHCI